MRSAGTPEEQAERQKDFRRSQSAMFILESKTNQLTRKINDLTAEIRDMRIKCADLERNLKEKEVILDSLERENELAEEELARVKKHMNTL